MIPVVLKSVTTEKSDDSNRDISNGDNSNEPDEFEDISVVTVVNRSAADGSGNEVEESALKSRLKEMGPGDMKEFPTLSPDGQVIHRIPLVPLWMGETNLMKKSTSRFKVNNMFIMCPNERPRRSYILVVSKSGDS